MLCKVCNKEIADGSKFCMFCGSSQEVQQPAVPEAPVAPEAPVFQEAPVVPFVPAAPVMPAEYRSEQPKPKKRLGLILGLVGGLVAVALVVVLILTLGGGGSGPWGRISEAMENTFEDGNFTFDLNAQVDGEALQIHGMMDVDIEERDLSLYMETELDGEKAQFVIHDGRQMSYSDGYWEYEDMSQDVMMMFMSLQSLQKSSGRSQSMDVAELIDLLMVTDPDAYMELSMMLDMDRLEDTFVDLGNNFCDEEWLATYMGYKTYEQAGETVYRFDMDMGKLVDGILLTLRPAFVHDTMYQMLVEEIRNDAEELSELVLVMELRVDGSYLTGMSYGAEIYGEYVNFDIRFSNPGSTDIQEDMLEDLLDEAERNA